MNETDPAPPAPAGTPSVGNTLGLTVHQRLDAIVLGLGRHAVAPGVRVVDFECELRDPNADRRGAAPAPLYRNRATRARRLGVVAELTAVREFIAARLDGQHIGTVLVESAHLHLAVEAGHASPPTGVTTPVPHGHLRLHIRDPAGQWGVIVMAFGVGHLNDQVCLTGLTNFVLGPADVSAAAFAKDVADVLAPIVTRPFGTAMQLDVAGVLLRHLFVQSGWRTPRTDGLKVRSLRMDLHTITLDLDRDVDDHPAAAPPPSWVSVHPLVARARRALAQHGRTRELLGLLGEIQDLFKGAPGLVAACARWRAALSLGLDPHIRVEALQAWHASTDIPRERQVAQGLLVSALGRSQSATHTLPLLPRAALHRADITSSARIRVARANVLLTEPDDAGDALRLLSPLEEPQFWEALHPVVRLEAAIAIARARVAIHALRSAGPPVLAMEALERALVAVPSAAARCRAFCALAGTLAQFDELDQARDLLDRALRESPRDIDALDQRIALACEAGPHETLRDLIERRLAANIGGAESPASVEALHGAATRLGDHDELTRRTATMWRAVSAADPAAHRAYVHASTDPADIEQRLAAARVASELSLQIPAYDDTLALFELWSSSPDTSGCIEHYETIAGTVDLPRDVEGRILQSLLTIATPERTVALIDRAVEVSSGPLRARALVKRARKTDARQHGARVRDLEEALREAPGLPEAIEALIEFTDDQDRTGLRRLVDHLSVHGDEGQLAHARRRLAAAAIALGDADEGRQILELMLQAAPDDPEVLHALTRLLSEQHKLSDLLALALPRLSVATPSLTELEIRVLTAQALAQRGDPVEGGRLIEQWHESGGALDQLPRPLAIGALELRFEGALRHGDIERALEIATLAVELDVVRSSRWFLRAAEHSTGATRLTTLRRLVALQPEDARALASLEDALREMEDRPGLIALLEHRSSTGTVVDRLHALRGLLDLMPTGPSASERRQEILHQILLLDPTDPVSLMSLASAERDPERSLALWERLSMVVESDDPRHALALIQLARHWVRAGEYLPARELLAQTLDHHPGNVEAIELGLRVAAHIAIPEWTRRCALAALALGDGSVSSPEVSLTLAEACLAMGHADEALVAAGRAARSADARSPLHTRATETWVQIANDHGSVAEQRLARLELRRCRGAALEPQDLRAELDLYVDDEGARLEAIEFAGRAIHGWPLVLVRALATWLDSLPLDAATSSAALAPALETLIIRATHTDARDALLPVTTAIARHAEDAGLVLRLLEYATVELSDDDIGALRRWALLHSGQLPRERRRLARRITDPDQRLDAAVLDRFTGCFEDPGECRDALATLAAKATPRRAAALARRALELDAPDTSLSTRLELLTPLAEAAATTPEDWSSLQRHLDTEADPAAHVTAVDLALLARARDRSVRATRPRAILDTAIARFPGHEPLIARLYAAYQGPSEEAAYDLRALIARLDGIADAAQFDAAAQLDLYERVAASSPEAVRNALLFERADAADARDPLRVLLVDTLTQRGAHAEVCALLERSGDTSPEGIAAWQRLADALPPSIEASIRSRVAWGTARALLEAEQPSDAIPHLRATCDTDPDNDRARLALGLALAETSQTEEAAQALGALVDRVPYPKNLELDRATLAMKCAGLARSSGDLEAARRWYGIARDESARGEADWLEAQEVLYQCFVEAAHDAHASAVAEEVARALEDANPLTLRWIRRCVSADGSIPRPLLDRGLSIRPSDPQLVGIALSQWTEFGDGDGVIQLLQAALEDWDGATHDPVPSRWRLELATRLGEVRDDPRGLDEAEQLWRHALEGDPESQRALHGLASVLRRRGDDAAAQSVLERAASFDPSHPDNHGTISAVARRLADQGDPEALTWIQRGLDSGLTQRAFLDTAVHATEHLPGSPLRLRVRALQRDARDLPARTRAEAAMELGTLALDAEDPRGLKDLELASTLAREVERGGELHAASARAWLTGLLDPTRGPPSPAMEVRARANLREALGPSLEPSAWRLEIDLLSEGPMKAPQAALALAIDAVATYPNDEALISRLLTLSQEVEGERHALATLQNAALRAEAAGRPRTLLLRSIAQLARTVGAAPRAQWAISALLEAGPLPAELMAIHAWTLRELGGAQEEIVRNLRGCAPERAEEVFQTVLTIVENSVERAARAITERLEVIPDAARRPLATRSIGAVLSSDVAVAVCLDEVIHRVAACGLGEAIPWDEVASAEGLPAAAATRVVRDALDDGSPPALVAGRRIADRALRTSPDRTTLRAFLDVWSASVPEHPADAVASLTAHIEAVGTAHAQASDLALMAAQEMPGLNWSALLHDILEARSRAAEPIEAIVAAMEQAGYFEPLLAHLRDAEETTADQFRHLARLAEARGDIAIVGEAGLEAARALHARDEHEAAHRELDRVLELDPTHLEALELYVDSLEAAHRWRDAHERITGLLSVTDGDASQLIRAGALAQKSHRLRACIQHWCDALALLESADTDLDAGPGSQWYAVASRLHGVRSSVGDHAEAATLALAIARTSPPDLAVTWFLRAADDAPPSTRMARLREACDQHPQGLESNTALEAALKAVDSTEAETLLYARWHARLLGRDAPPYASTGEAADRAARTLAWPNATTLPRDDERTLLEHVVRDPGTASPSHHARLAEILAHDGDLDAARSQYALAEVASLEATSPALRDLNFECAVRALDLDQDARASIERWEAIATRHPTQLRPWKMLAASYDAREQPEALANALARVLELEPGPRHIDELSALSTALMRRQEYTRAVPVLAWASAVGGDDREQRCRAWIEAAVLAGLPRDESDARADLARVLGDDLPKADILAEFHTNARVLERSGLAAKRLLQRARDTGDIEPYLGLLGESVGAEFPPEAFGLTARTVLHDLPELLLPCLRAAVNTARTHGDPEAALSILRLLTQHGGDADALVNVEGWALRETGQIDQALDTLERDALRPPANAPLAPALTRARALMDADLDWGAWALELCERSEAPDTRACIETVLNVALESEFAALALRSGALWTRRSAPGDGHLPGANVLFELLAQDPSPPRVEALLDFAEVHFERGGAPTDLLDGILSEHIRRGDMDPRAVRVLMLANGLEDERCLRVIAALCTGQLSASAQVQLWSLAVRQIPTLPFATTAVEEVLGFNDARANLRLAENLRARPVLPALVRLVREGPWDRRITELALETSQRLSAPAEALVLIEILLAIATATGDRPAEARALEQALALHGLEPERTEHEVALSVRLAGVAMENRDLDAASAQLERLVRGDLRHIACQRPDREVEHWRALQRVELRRGDRFAAARAAAAAAELAVKEGLSSAPDCVESLLDLTTHLPADIDLLRLLESACELGTPPRMAANWMLRAAKSVSGPLARTLLQRALELDPADEAAAMALELLLEASGDITALHEFYHWRLNRIGAPQTHQDRRIARRYIERLRASLRDHAPESPELDDLLETLVIIEPDHVDARLEQGLARLERGDDAGAVAAFELVLAHLDPEDPRGFQPALSVGIALFERAPERAATLLLRAHALRPDAQQLDAPLASLAAIPLPPGCRLEVVEACMARGLNRQDLQWLRLDLLHELGRWETLQTSAQELLQQDLDPALRRSALQHLVDTDRRLNVPPQMLASHLMALADVAALLGDDPGSIRAELPALWQAHGLAADDALELLERWLVDAADPLPYLQGHARFALPEQPRRHEAALRSALERAEDPEAMHRLLYAIAHAAMVRDAPEEALSALSLAAPDARENPELVDLRSWAIRHLNRVDDELTRLIDDLQEERDPTRRVAQMFALFPEDPEQVFEQVLRAFPRLHADRRAPVLGALLTRLEPSRPQAIRSARELLATARRFELQAILLAHWPTLTRTLVETKGAAQFEADLEVLRQTLHAHSPGLEAIHDLAVAVVAVLKSPDPLVELYWAAVSDAGDPIARAHRVGDRLETLTRETGPNQVLVTRSWEKLIDLLPPTRAAEFSHDRARQSLDACVQTRRALADFFHQRGDWHALTTLLERDASDTRRDPAHRIYALEQLTAIYGDALHDPETAIRRAEAALELAPDRVQSRVLLFDRLIEGARFVDAVELAERFCLSEELHRGARDVVIRKAMDAAIVHGDYARAVTLGMQRSSATLAATIEQLQACIDGASHPDAITPLLEDIAARHGGTLRRRAHERLAETLMREQGDFERAARVLAALVDEHPERVDLLEDLERCYARIQRWDLLASQLTRLALRHHPETRRTLLARAAQVQRVRLQNPGEAERLLAMAVALPGQPPRSLILALARCQFERAQFEAVVETCRAPLHDLAAEGATASRRGEASARAIAQLMADAVSELHGLERALMDVFESLHRLNMLPSHAVAPLADHYLEADRFDDYLALSLDTAREHFGHGEFRQAGAFLERQALALESHPTPPSKLLLQLHCLAFLSAPEMGASSRRRALALFRDATSPTVAVTLTRSMLEMFDESRKSAGYLLLADALADEDPSESRCAYDTALEHDPRAVLAKIGQARLLMRAELLTPALEQLREVLREDSLSPDARAESSLMCAECLLRLGEDEERFLVLDRAFARVPAQWRIGATLAVLLRERGLIDREFAVLHTLRRQDLPSQPMARVHLRLGEILLRHAEVLERATPASPGEAERWVQAALRLDPDLDAARATLVEIKRTTGDLRSMAALWQAELARLPEGGARASRLLDLAQLHVHDLPAEAVSLDFLMRALVEPSISVSALERAEHIVRSYPRAAEAASSLILRAGSLPNADHRVRVRLLDLAAIAWSCAGDAPAAALARAAAEEDVARAARAPEVPTRPRRRHRGASQPGHTASLLPNADWPLERWVNEMAGRALLDPDARDAALVTLADTLLVKGSVTTFVETLETAVLAADPDTAAALQLGTVHQLLRYALFDASNDPLLGQCLATLPGSTARCQQVLNLLEDHGTPLAVRICHHLDDPVAPEQLLVLLSASLLSVHLGTPMRVIAQLPSLEPLTQRLTRTEWVRERLEEALAITWEPRQKASLLRAIRGTTGVEAPETRAKVQRRLIDLLETTGEREAALRECRAAIAEDVDNAALCERYVRLSRSARLDDHVLHALRTLARVSETTDARGHWSLEAALALRARGREDEEMHALFRAAVECRPHHPETRMAAAEQSFKEGDYAAATAHCRAFIEHHGEVDDRLCLGALAQAMAPSPTGGAGEFRSLRSPSVYRASIICAALSQVADHLAEHGPLSATDDLLHIAGDLADLHHAPFREIFVRWNRLQRCRTGGDFLIRGRLAEQAGDQAAAFWSYELAARAQPAGVVRGLSKHLPRPDVDFDRLQRGHIFEVGWDGPLADFFVRARWSTVGITRTQRTHTPLHAERGRRVESNVRRLWQELGAFANLDVNILVVEEPLGCGCLALEDGRIPTLLVHPDFNAQSPEEQRFRVARFLMCVQLGLTPVTCTEAVPLSTMLDTFAVCVDPGRARADTPSARFLHRLLDQGIGAIELDAPTRRKITAEIAHWTETAARCEALEGVINLGLDVAATWISGTLVGALETLERDRSDQVVAEGHLGDALDPRVTRLLRHLGLPAL